ncbi:MAG: FtsW/RodA/SpoVE family cell cycle protein [Rikenellaceae bacterium]
MAKTFKEKISKVAGGDRTLWMVIIWLMFASVLVVYSSTASLAYAKNDGQTTTYLISQIKFAIFGLLTVFLIHLINYQFYFRHGRVIFKIALIMMALTFVIGVEINGERRWLGIPGTSLTFQPADFLKIALIMVLAIQLAARQKIIDHIPILPSFNYASWRDHPERNSQIFFKTTIPIIFPIAISAILVLVSNLSTALIMCGACLIVLIIGRVRWKEIFRLIFLAIIILALIVVVFKGLGISRADTWINRTTTFFSSDKTVNDDSKQLSEDEFQAQQARIAVASGWILGKGPGKSTQRSNLPHPYSDYAYAFVVEEYGIVGALFILGCYLWIFYRAIVIFRRCESSFPSLLVLGLSLIITLQAMLHIGVSVDAFPVTGQTLPIISKGGSSMIFTCIMFGIILGVSRQINEVNHAKGIEQKKQLIADEWQQIIFENQDIDGNDSEIKKLFNENSEEYQGVIWNDKEEDKDNS